MAKWVKCADGNYANLSRAITVECEQIARNDWQVIAYFNKADDNQVVFLGTEQECRDWMRETIGVIFVGTMPGGKEYRKFIPGETPDEEISVEDIADSTVNKSSEKDYGSNKRTRFQRD